MINKLAGAIKIQTTADVNDKNMPVMHKYIEENFPLVHKNMTREFVGNSLLFKISGEGNPIMFCGHMDVVASNQPEWTCDPYEGKIDEKYLWGRGAFDCKGTVFGILCAMESLFQDGFKPSRTIYLAFGHDEEIGGLEGATNIVKKLENEGVFLDFLLDEGGHISKNFLPDRNYATIALAEKNVLRLKLSAPAKGGHAAYITDKTAIYRLSKAIIAIEENPMDKKIIPLIQKYIDTMSENYPQLVENYIDKKENNPFVRTTFAPTMLEASAAINILPANPSVSIDIRMLPGNTKEEVIEYIENLVKDFDIKIEILSLPKSAGKSSDFNSVFYKNIESLIKEKFDDAIVVPALMAGGTDASHYEKICDVVLRFMPILMDTDTFKTLHTANERIEIKSFEKAVDFYKEFIKRNG